MTFETPMLFSLGFLVTFLLGGLTFKSWRYGEPVTLNVPWGHGNSLERATSCTPPRHNFTELPRIRSERTAFELHYPHMVERLRAESHVGRQKIDTATAETADVSPGGAQ
jgi:cytochrome c oxidase subunit I